MALPTFGRFARGSTTPTTTPKTNPSSGSTNSGTSGTASSTSGVTKADATPTTPTTSTPKTTTTTPTTPSVTAIKAATTTTTPKTTSTPVAPVTPATTTPKTTTQTTPSATSTTKSSTPSFGRFNRDSSSSRPKAGDIVVRDGKEYKYAGNSVKPVEATTVSSANADTLATTSTNNQLIGGETSTSSSSYYDVDSALNNIYNQAKAAGINVAKPTSYGQSITDANRAQKLIDDYTANANSIAAKSSKSSSPSTSSSKPVYDISSNISEVQAAVKDYNLGIAAPKTTQYSSQAEAQSALNSYIDTTQKALDTWSQNQPVQVYDDLGRQQTVTQSQWQQMDAASKNQTWRENYTVLPEEVANSGANWWINSNGLYEWTPVTAGDKAHLEQQNAQRKRLGQAPKTTLTAGASPSEAYSKEWYSTGGNRTQAAGNEKLAKLKASSTVNNSSSAKSNTAQQQKATVWSAPKTQAVKIETAAKQQAAAKESAAAAEKAAQQAKDAAAEATLKQQQVTAAQAKLKQTANAKEQAAIKQEIKTLQADANAAKKAANAANANASATKELATATAAIATASSSPFTASKVPDLSKNVKEAQKAVEKTSTAAIKAGVVDHTGQVLLKDGTWINQVETKGITSKGESGVKVFGTTAAYQAQTEAEYTAKQSGSSPYGKANHTLNPVYESAYKNTIATQKAAQELYQKQRDTYEAKPILGSKGEKLDPIWTGGKKAGIGESDVNIYVKNAAGAIISRSGTAAEYNQAEKDRAKYSAMDYVEVTEGMTEKQRQRAVDTNAKIDQARRELIERTPISWNANKNLSLVSTNPWTGETRINAKQGTFSDIQPFKTRAQLAEEQYHLNTRHTEYERVTHDIKDFLASPKDNIVVAGVSGAARAVKDVATIKEGSRGDKFQKSMAVTADRLKNVYTVKPGSEAERVSKDIEAFKDSPWDNVVVKGVTTGVSGAVNAVKEAYRVKPGSEAERVGKELSWVSDTVKEAYRVKPGSRADWWITGLKTTTPEDLKADYQHIAGDAKSMAKSIATPWVDAIHTVADIYKVKPGSEADRVSQELSNAKAWLKDAATIKEGSRGDMFIKTSGAAIDKGVASIKDVATIKPGSEAARVISDIENFKASPRDNIVVKGITTGVSTTLDTAKNVFKPKPGSEAERVGKELAAAKDWLKDVYTIKEGSRGDYILDADKAFIEQLGYDTRDRLDQITKNTKEGLEYLGEKEQQANVWAAKKLEWLPTSSELRSAASSAGKATSAIWWSTPGGRTLKAGIGFSQTAYNEVPLFRAAIDGAANNPFVEKTGSVIGTTTNFGSQLGEATVDVASEAWDFARTKPVSTTKELGILAAEMYVTGGALTGAKIIGRGALMKTSKLIGTNTGKLLLNSNKIVSATSAATKTPSLAAIKLATAKTVTKNEGLIRDVSGATRGVFNTGAKAVNPIVDTSLIASVGNELYGQASGSKYTISTSGISKVGTNKDLKGFVKSVGSLAIGGSAFAKGAKHVDVTFKKTTPNFHALAEEGRYDWTPFSAVSSAVSKAKEATGITRGQVLETDPLAGHDHVTMASRGSVADELLYGESSTVHVQRAGMRPAEVGKTFSGVESGLKRAKIYDSNGTLVTGRTARVKAIESIKAGRNEYTYDMGNDPMVGTIEKPAHGIYASISSKTGLEPVSKIFTSNSNMTNPNPKSWVSRRVEQVLTPIVDKHGLNSKIGQVAAKIGGTEYPGTSFKQRNANIALMEIDKVKLPTELRDAIASDIATTGKISKEHYNAQHELAKQQVAETGRPVAIIAPKTREGWLHQENELFIVTDPKASIVTQKQFAGYSDSGVKIEKVVLGSQSQLKSSVWSNIKENVKHNWNIGVDKYSLMQGKGFYNKAVQASEEATIVQRRTGELYTKDKLTQPGSWEAGRHGKEHTDAVGENAAAITRENPQLGVSEEHAKLMGTAHDLDKLYWMDHPNTDHGIVAARAIRDGKTGLPEIDSLPKAARQQLADDIAWHDVQQPWSSGNLKQALLTTFVRRTSTAAKVVSNADRMDLKRFSSDPNWKPDPNRIFRLPGEKVRNTSRSVDNNAVARRTNTLEKAETKTIEPYTYKRELQAYPGSKTRDRVNEDPFSTYGKAEHIIKPYEAGYKIQNRPKYGGINSNYKEVPEKSPYEHKYGSNYKEATKKPMSEYKYGYVFGSTEHSSNGAPGKSYEYKSKPYDYDTTIGSPTLKPYDYESQLRDYKSKSYDYKTKSHKYNSQPYDYKPKPYDYKPSPYDYITTPYDYKTTPYDYKPKPYDYKPKSYDSKTTPNYGSQLYINNERNKKRVDDEDERVDIKKRARAKDKQLKANTKVASFSEMFSSPKRKSNPFKRK